MSGADWAPIAGDPLTPRPLSRNGRGEKEYRGALFLFSPLPLRERGWG
jgi:hypothetical protein